MRHAWAVTLRPVASNEGKNTGGIMVALTDGDAEFEVVRVAYARRNSKNPDAEFGEQLDAEIEKAQRCAEALNDMLDDLERAEDEKILKVRDMVREILGPPPRLNARGA